MKIDKRKGIAQTNSRLRSFTRKIMAKWTKNS